MTTPFPKEVKIGYRRLAVSLEKDLAWNGNASIAGLYCPDKLTIQISKTLPASTKCETLLHEVLHAFWDEYNLPPDNEENLVRCLANALTGMFVDNPKFVKYLMENCNGR